MTDRPPTKATLGITVLRSYRREWLKGDVAAAVTIGALLITQCMAYAPLAGLPPEAAFHAVVIALPVYALFGTSRHLVVGPDPGTAAVAGTGLASVAAVGTLAHLEAAAVVSSGKVLQAMSEMGRAGIEPATLGSKVQPRRCGKLQQTESACKWPLSTMRQTATNCSLRRQAGTLTVWS